jgi:hypothetical protein
MNLKSVIKWTWRVTKASIHAIQSRSDVAHHRHEEEWHLKYGMLKEVEAIDDAFVHVRMVHIDEEGEYP